MEINEKIMAKRVKKKFFPHVAAIVGICLLIGAIIFIMPNINAFLDKLLFEGFINFNTTLIKYVGLTIIILLVIFAFYDYSQVTKWNLLPDYYITFDGTYFIIYLDKVTKIDSKSISLLSYSFDENKLLGKLAPKQRITGTLVISYMDNGSEKKINVKYVFDVEKVYRKMSEITDSNEEFINVVK